MNHLQKNYEFVFHPHVNCYISMRDFEKSALGGIEDAIAAKALVNRLTIK